MTDAEFLLEVKRYVLEIDPQAEVWLFGSRARGDARPDSDWDFLVLTDNDLSGGGRWQFSDHLFDIELETGKMISTIVWPKRILTSVADNPGSEMISTIVWPKRERNKFAVTDLYANVMDEGVLL